MKRLSTRSVLSTLAFILFGILLGAQLQASLSPDDGIEQFKKMKRAFLLISGKYFEQVSAKRLAEGGVDGMLKRLDPHSQYVPPEEVDRKRDRMRGSFGGVGIRFDILNDTARVISSIDDGPSKRAGIRAGDRIIKVEGSSAIGLSQEDVRNRLTGKKGTSVSFTIYRPLTKKRLTFTITRDEIPLYSINSAYMVDNRTGYMEIGRFSKSTHDEFLKRVDALKEKGMERLLIDLRGNEGGVMEPAIKIADEMLGRPGMTIVETKGRVASANQTWRTQNGGALANAPVTLLVDRNTASSSEVLAGALQDHDRALLVGRRTYGKGLVQKSYSLNDESLLSLTVGAYYTPVGRFIQTPYENGSRKAYLKKKLSSRREAVYNVRAYKNSIPDSLTYHTEHGRTVFGGGGILPDYVIQPDTASLKGFLQRSEADRLFKFHASQWFSKHDQDLRSRWLSRKDEFLSTYDLPDQAVSSFWSYAQQREMLTLTTNSDSVAPHQNVFPKSETQAASDIVRTHVKGQLANVIFGNESGKPILNKFDPTVQKALSLWPSSQELASYHTGSNSTRKNE